MNNQLEYLIYGKPPVAQQSESAWDVLHHSEGLAPAQGKIYYQQMPLDAISDDVASFGMMRIEPEYYLVAQAIPNRTQFVRIAATDVKALKGDIAPLVNLFAQPLSPTTKLSAPINWTFDLRLSTIAQALELVGGDMLHLLMVLAGALASEGLYISHFPNDQRLRLQFMQGLVLLIPEPFRYYLTFCSHALRVPPNRPRLIFCDKPTPTTRKFLGWNEWNLQPEPNSPGTHFVSHLAGLWRGDLEAFAQILKELDNIANHLDILDVGLAQNVDEVAHRHMLDLAVLDPTSDVSTEAILSLLEGTSPPSDVMRENYLVRLLQIALDKRDPKASVWVARAMDNNALLDIKLNKLLDQAIEDQPDAVYAFVRAHLNENMDERWITRLHKSAKRSLDVAITCEEPETITIWLQLLAREPQRYGLSDILHESILRAIPVSYQYPSLAREMLTIATKREPITLVKLLDDRRFVEGLPPEVVSGVVDHDPRILDELALESRELFLLAIARAADESNGTISLQAVRDLWDIYSSRANFIIAEPYRPLNLIKKLVGQARQALQDGGLNALLVAMLASGDDTLFYEVATMLAQEEVLAPLLVNVLRGSERAVEDVLNIVTVLTSEGSLSPQNASNVYVTLLDDANWDEKTMLPMAEQLARLMSQHPEIRLVPNVLWHLIELPASQKNEVMVKGAVKRLLGNLTQSESEEQLVKDLVRLRKAIHAQPNTRNLVQMWWRDYTQSQATAQLQKIERALDGNRTVDDLRMTLSTTLGIRKQLSNKQLDEWAQDINTAFRVLKALSDGFDPEHRSTAIDVGTIQRAIEPYLDGLSSDVRHVLATNLKDLAELVAMMADSRSKPSLIRNDEMLERQLMTGEQQPQSAVDVMKWLAGYLEGTQKNGL